MKPFILTGGLVSERQNSPATTPPEFPQLNNPVSGHWSSCRSYVLLGILTLACLLPFSGRAFHVDDTLFVMAARQINQHPLDPYGFTLIWSTFRERMADVTMNPPLACYYGAAVGWLAGWSERAFHLAFLLPALALVLGTYRLARHFTQTPLLAALATLLTPGILVSACSVMCDTMMVALWVWAVVFWIEGLEPQKARYLIGAAFLIAASALTKYFGASLIPLLTAYSFVRLRRWGSWLWYLLIPVAALGGYEVWTHALYGQGLLASAANFSSKQRAFAHASRLPVTLIGLSFTGGCTLSVLAFLPLTWTRKVGGVVAACSSLASCALIFGWVDFGLRVGREQATAAVRANWALLAGQLALFIAGGLVILGLAIADYWGSRSPESLLLGLWVLGTFAFFGFFNWSVNGRSVLPLIPAAAILMARRLGKKYSTWTPDALLKVTVALLLSGIISIWVASADSRLANLAREAAGNIQRRTRSKTGTLWYEGHWGFQYYMQQTDALQVDAKDSLIHPGDLVVIPANNADLAGLPDNMFFQQETVLEFQNPSMATTINWQMGAAFYSSYWGPLPFTFGPVPPERYYLLRASSAH